MLVLQMIPSHENLLKASKIAMSYLYLNESPILVRKDRF